MNSKQNTLLRDAREYRAARLQMQHPKDWGHVRRVVLQAVHNGEYDHIPSEEQDFGKRVLYRLVRLELYLAPYKRQEVRRAKLAENFSQVRLSAPRDLELVSDGYGQYSDSYKLTEAGLAKLTAAAEKVLPWA